MKLEQDFFNPPKILSNDFLDYEKKKLDLIKKIKKNKFGFQKELNFPRKKEIDDIVKKLKKFSTIIFLGTGGSSLGGKTLVSIMENKINSRKEIHFLENIDFESIEKVLNKIDLDKTAIVAISKSGETFETISQLFFITNKFDELGIYKKKRIFIITEKKNSFLKSLQENEDYYFLEHSSEIGGRFSIFSIVGLIPAKLSGFNIEKFCKSAQQFIKKVVNDMEIFDYYFKPSFYQYFLFKKGINISVMMPYVDCLSNFALWFRQLFAESIGKKGKGATPINALGTVDQHSQLQLYLDGPMDKFFTIIIRKLNKKKQTTLDCNYKGGKFELLHNKSLEQLLHAEMKATLETIKNKGLPIRIFKLTSIDEDSIGELSIFYFIEIIFMCELFNVNPFNQPAVEEGKRLTKSYL